MVTLDPRNDEKRKEGTEVDGPIKCAVGFLQQVRLIGPELVARPQVMKKLWDYIKAHNLQDATNKRAINADAKLLKVFGKEQVTMFELAGIAGKHLS